MLAVSFLLKEDTNWAKKGHEIAWDEMIVQTPLLPLEEPELNGKVSYAENEKELTISGSKFKYIIDKKTGNFSSLQYYGTEYLEGGPVFNVWRAPLANDIDPWGSHQFQDRNFTPGFGRSIDNQLRTLGMRDLVQQVDDIEVQQNTSSKLFVKIKAFSNTTQAANTKLTGYVGVSAFQRNETWVFLADGTIELEQEIIPHGPMPDMLQKIGLQFQLPKQFSNIEWYGRGPFENYPDRKTGAKVGHYFSTADEMYVPYIFPQEYGNRSDVRWLKVQNADGKGLIISGGDLLNFSLHKYTTDNLDRAVYTYQLKESFNTILNVDYEVTGVGGTAIRQLQRYRVMPHAGNYKLRIKPF
jgi:beta-galactosidase